MIICLKFKQYKHFEPQNGISNLYQQTIHPSLAPIPLCIMKMLLLNDYNIVKWKIDQSFEKKLTCLLDVIQE